MDGAILQYSSIGKSLSSFHPLSSTSRPTYLLSSICLSRPQGQIQKFPRLIAAHSIMHQEQSTNLVSLRLCQFNVEERQYSSNIFRKSFGDNCRSSPSSIPVIAIHSPDDFESSDDKDIDKDLPWEFNTYFKCTNGKDRVALVGGIDSTLLDVDGKVYLDFNCNSPFGHSDHETLSSFIAAHPAAINHGYLKEEVSKQLIVRSFADQAFLTNSQTEAIKLAFAIAMVHQQLLHPLSSGEVNPAVELIAFNDTFHGQTIDWISPLDHQGKPFAHRGLPGVTLLNHGDIETALKLIKEGRFAAVLVEPFQGKDGTDLATKEFLRALRVACNNAGCLLIFDEIQCGYGRTGSIWAHQAYGICPDMMVIGDPLANGLSFGAVLVNDRVGRSIRRAEQDIHSVSLAFVLEVINKLSNRSLPGVVRKKAEYFKLLLTDKIKGNSHVKEVRPIGLAIGIEFHMSALPLVDACRKSGLLIATFRTPNEIMLRPPLIISKDELNKAAEILLQSMLALDKVI